MNKTSNVAKNRLIVGSDASIAEFPCNCFLFGVLVGLLLRCCFTSWRDSWGQSQSVSLAVRRGISLMSLVSFGPLKKEAQGVNYEFHKIYRELTQTPAEA